MKHLGMLWDSPGRKAHVSGPSREVHGAQSPGPAGQGLISGAWSRAPLWGALVGQSRSRGPTSVLHRSREEAREHFIRAEIQGNLAALSWTLDPRPSVRQVVLSVPSAGVGDNDKPSSSVTAAMRLPGTVRWEVPSLHETSAATSVSFRPVPQSSVRGRLSRPRGWAHGHDAPRCSELPGAPVLLCSPVLSALCSSSLHGTSSLVTSASDPQHPTCLFSKLDEDVCSHGA